MQLKPINHADNSGLFPYSMVSFSMIAGKTTIDGRLLWSSFQTSTSFQVFAKHS